MDSSTTRQTDKEDQKKSNSSSSSSSSSPSTLHSPQESVAVSPYRYSSSFSDENELDLSRGKIRSAGGVALAQNETGFGMGGGGVYIPGDEFNPFASQTSGTQTKKDLYSQGKSLGLGSFTELSLTPSLAIDSRATQEQQQQEKCSLEPIPPYHEQHSSFTCNMDKSLPEAEMVHGVFQAVQSGLDSDDLANTSSYHLKEAKNSIRGICYKNNSSAHWKMKVYKGKSQAGTQQLMVEFQRRMGCAVAFRHFYTTLFQQEQILKLREVEKDETPAPSSGFMDLLPCPPPLDYDASETGEEWPVKCATMQEQMEAFHLMDESSVKALEAWARSEFIDQRREGVRVLATLTEVHRTQDVLVEKKMPLIELLFDGLRCNDDEVQRLSSVALEQCAANPKLQDALSREFRKVLDVLQSLVSSLATPNHPLEALDTQRHLTSCVKHLLGSENSQVAHAVRDPYQAELSKLRLLSV